MKVVRWPELDIIESELKPIDDFYYKTSVGPILIGKIFPVSQIDVLKDLKSRIEAS